MCGIVGYTGPREAGPILIEGLRRLEYRGYDSAGIALVDEEGDLFVEKKAGKLANLQEAIANRTPHAAIGLAHTRWATHGRPNDLNAHPHQDCTGNITVMPANLHDPEDGPQARIGTCGFERTGMQVSIQGDDGRELKAFETGEICVIGPAVFAGYWFTLLACITGGAHFRR